jgi:hypothetical protein
MTLLRGEQAPAADEACCSSRWRTVELPVSGIQYPAFDTRRQYFYAIHFADRQHMSLSRNAQCPARNQSCTDRFAAAGLHPRILLMSRNVTIELVEQRDAAGNVGAAASLSFTLDTVAPHLTGITASPGCGNGTAGSTVHFTLAFDEATQKQNPPARAGGAS